MRRKLNIVNPWQGDCRDGQCVEELYIACGKPMLQAEARQAPVCIFNTVFDC